MAPQVPENTEILIEPGTIMVLNGLITFTNPSSLRLHVEECCRNEADAAYRQGFLMGVFACVCLGIALGLFRMIWL